MSAKPGRYGNRRPTGGSHQGIPWSAAAKTGLKPSAHSLAKRKALSGEPAKAGHGYCPECFREVPVRKDGTLQSHRPNGYLCLGNGALPFTPTTTDEKGTTA